MKKIARWRNDEMDTVELPGCIKSPLFPAKESPPFIPSFISPLLILTGKIRLEGVPLTANRFYLSLRYVILVKAVPSTSGSVFLSRS